jgi:hypothetical protein
LDQSGPWGPLENPLGAAKLQAIRRSRIAGLKPEIFAFLKNKFFLKTSFLKNKFFEKQVFLEKTSFFLKKNLQYSEISFNLIVTPYF